MDTVYNGTKDLNRALKNLDSKPITKKNKQFIKEFVSFLAANSISKVRQRKYIYGLQHVAEWLKIDFDKAVKHDIQRICGIIENKDDYTDWTKHDHKIFIKKFYNWLRNKHIEDIDEWETPKEVKWIKAKKPRNVNKLPSDLLTPQDIELLSDHCRNLREKALIRTLYETGARIGEILNLKIRDVEFDEYGAMLNLFGKTGYRKIRVIGCASTIEQWLKQEHPQRDDKNAYLFCNINKSSEGEILTYASAKKLLNKLKQRSGFKKPLNPHHFRHSRATELAEKLTDSQRCHYLGWQQGSQMARIYTHIEDTNRVILELNGLVRKDSDEQGRKVRLCPRCNTKNPGSAKYCIQCSLGLDLKSIEDFEKSSKRAIRTIEDTNKLEAIVEMVMKRLEDHEG